MHERLLGFCWVGLVAAGLGGGCEEVLDQVIEQNAGCSEAQLAGLQEPALPHCSHVVACCKFLKGECGKVQAFTPPAEVLTICNANEEAMTAAFAQYRSIDGQTCPAYLKAESCTGGKEQTQTNFVRTVDQGAGELGSVDAPSCSLIVGQMDEQLQAQLGAQAKLLPDACSPMN